MDHLCLGATEDFIKGQEEGTIPLTEDFDPIWIFHQGATLEEVHPHWISLRGRLHLQKLHKDGRVPHPVSCGFVFVISARITVASSGSTWPKGRR